MNTWMIVIWHLGLQLCFRRGRGLGVTDYNWIRDNDFLRWFLSKLKLAIEIPIDFILISDRHKCIFNIVRHVYSDALHVICYYHLINNLKHYGIKCGNAGVYWKLPVILTRKKSMMLFWMIYNIFNELKKIGEAR